MVVGSDADLILFGLRASMKHSIRVCSTTTVFDMNRVRDILLQVTDTSPEFGK
jgi:hypothetical protein